MFGFASLFTLGILLGFVAAILLLLMYYGGQIDATFLIIGTIVINFLLWLIAPFFMELVYRFFYKSRKITIEDLRQKRAKVAEFIEKTCTKYKFKVPRLFIIEDDNPTAFVFGSAAYNARLVFSEGLFTYLDEDEMVAVIAHELGHIRRRDFIIMTIASTIVQILYELSQLIFRTRSKNNNKKNPLILIGILSYVFYFLGSYLLLFLSRTREYGADSFSANETGNPDALSRALIKIAYGIIAKPDTASQARLLNSTRTLGIFDPHAAKHVGTAFMSASKDWNFIAKVLLFDLVSPWAKIMELGSTHPLTGKRIEKLSEMASRLGQTPSINIQMVKQTPYDKSRLYHGFGLGLFIHFLPQVSLLGILVSAAFSGNTLVLLLIPSLLGLSLLIKLKYKYPGGQAEKTTTLEAMSDLYASPVRGRLIELEGKTVGKGIAGSYISEDLMFQDQNGLIYLNYESAIPIFGNLFFGLSKVKKLIGVPAKASGWFLRGVSHHLDLKNYSTTQKSFNSHPMLWGSIFAIILIMISAIGFLQSASAGIQ